jgi:Mu-like prophage I protein
MAKDRRLTLDAALMRAGLVLSTRPLTRDPELQREFNKHEPLDGTRKASMTADVIARMAKIRQLRTKNPDLTFDAAFTQVCREESESKATARHAGSLLRVTAHSVALSGDVPREIMYMPAGRTVLTPSVNGQAKTISVNVTRSTADLLQSDLERLLKQNVPPIICFDHSETRAAAIPERFTWKEGQGVFLQVDWTASGRSAIEGHDYGWLSPTFMLSEDGSPAGLPRAGGSIGSLTNRPAFTSIARIAAA